MHGSYKNNNLSISALSAQIVKCMILNIFGCFYVHGSYKNNNLSISALSAQIVKCMILNTLFGCFYVFDLKMIMIYVHLESCLQQYLVMDNTCRQNAPSSLQ